MDIIARDVRKYFKDVRAVDGIDLQIAGGEFVAVLGPNGAGKTTLVEMIEGIQTPDSGEILIKGKKWAGNKHELNRIIGLSLQETHFIDKLTVAETLRLFASFYRLEDTRVEEIMGVVGLTEKRKAYTVHLSGGQRQRLALGIALLNRPQILLLDEPTTGLDPSARRDVWDILLNLKKIQKTSLILTTHYMEEAETLCDRIIIMDHGKILAEGTLDHLLSASNSKEVIEFFPERPEMMDAVTKKCGSFEISWDDRQNKGSIEVENIVTTLPLFMNWAEKQVIKLKSLECRRMTLDDLFIQMTGRRLNE